MFYGHLPFYQVLFIKTVEIIERKDKNFAISFQFHPEAAYVKHLEVSKNSYDFTDAGIAATIFKKIGSFVK